MSYLFVFAFPFLGPFLRRQPFKGVTAFLGWVVLAFLGIVVALGIKGGIGALLFGGVIFYLPWSWRECHNLWNYRRDNIVIDDYR